MWACPKLVVIRNRQINRRKSWQISEGSCERALNKQTNKAYKLAYNNLKRDFDEATKKYNETILALAVEKTELSESNKKYKEIVESLAEEVNNLTKNLKNLNHAGEENVMLREKVYKLEEELCQLTLNHNNTLIQNQQLKQNLKSLQGKIIDYITESNN